MFKRITGIILVVVTIFFILSVVQAQDEGILLHLDASMLSGLSTGDKVSIWGDAVQENEANRPVFTMDGLNGAPSVRFDGSSTFMNIKNLKIPYETTVFIVAKDTEQTAGGSAFRVILAADNDPYPKEGADGYGIAYMKSDAPGFSVYIHDGEVLDNLVVNEAPRESAEICTVVKKHTDLSLYRDSNYIRSTVFDKAEDSSWHTGYFLGAETSRGSERFYKGDIAEVIVYDHALTAAKRLEIEGRLSKKYNIPITENPYMDGLCAWYTADSVTHADKDEKVSYIKDQSGFDNNIYQFNANKKPFIIRHALDKKPVVRFTGESSLNSPNFKLDGNFSVFMLVKPEFDGEIIGSLYREGQSVYFQNGYAVLGDSAVPSENGKFSVISFEYDKSTKLLNGYIENNQVSEVCFEGGFYGLSVGGISNGFKGEIAEILIYDRQLSESGRNEVQKYFSTKYFKTDDYRFIDNGVTILDPSYCDQPYMIKCDDGSWLAVITKSDGIENSPDRTIVTVKSFDEGKTWTEPRANIEPKDALQPSWATLFKTSFGRLYTFYNVGTGSGSKVYFTYRYSDDNGDTWSEAFKLPMRETAIDKESDKVSSWGVCPPFTDNGSMYFSFTKFVSDIDANRHGEGFIFKSENIDREKDSGKIQWTMLPEDNRGVRNDSFSNLQEEHILVPLGNNSFYMTFRTLDGKIGEAYSYDGCKTWTKPEYIEYEANGLPLKNVRAVPRVFKASDDRFLLWYHNHDGRNVAAKNKDRNPAWVSGGVLKNGKIYWSQPEIMLYGFDFEFNAGMSYPDLFMNNGNYYITETEKTMARIHKIDPSLFEGVWNQSTEKTEYTENRAASLEKGLEYAKLPSLIDGGITLDFTIDTNNLKNGEVITNGDGINVEVVGGDKLKLTLFDGRNWKYTFTSDPFIIDEKTHEIAIVIDGKSNYVTTVYDGIVCDGGEKRQFGFDRFSMSLGDVSGNGKFVISDNIKDFYAYNTNLTHSMVIRNHKFRSEYGKEIEQNP